MAIRQISGLRVGRRLCTLQHVPKAQLKLPAEDVHSITSASNPFGGLWVSA